MITGIAGLQTIQVQLPGSVARGRSFLQFVSDQAAEFWREQRQRQKQAINQEGCEQHCCCYSPASI